MLALTCTYMSQVGVSRRKRREHRHFCANLAVDMWNEPVEFLAFFCARVCSLFLRRDFPCMAFVYFTQRHRVPPWHRVSSPVATACLAQERKAGVLLV